MAIGWLSVLKSVPWTEVIGNAPKVAEGAKKLWQTVAKKKSEAPAAEVVAPPPVPDAERLANLEASSAASQAAVSDLQAQMLASSELIKELAEQNAQLIARVDLAQRRLRWLGAVAGLALAAAVVCLVVILWMVGLFS